jgi:hypothetical protein
VQNFSSVSLEIGTSYFEPVMRMPPVFYLLLVVQALLFPFLLSAESKQVCMIEKIGPLEFRKFDLSTDQILDRGRSEYGEETLDEHAGHDGMYKWNIPNTSLFIGFSSEDLSLSYKGTLFLERRIRHPSVECGVQIGMSVDEVKALFPEVKGGWVVKKEEGSVVYSYHLGEDDPRVSIGYDAYFYFKQGKLYELYVHHGC